MTKRIQRSRAKGWRMPSNAVYVGRPSIWGNPFTHPQPAVAVEEYRRFLRGGPQSFKIEPGGLQLASDIHKNALHWAYPEFVRQHIHQLHDRDLACWCPLDQPCHADVLLELANAIDPPQPSLFGDIK